MAKWNVDVPTSEYYGPLPFNPQGIKSSDVHQLIHELKYVREIAIDTETTGLSKWGARVLYWSLAWGNRRCTLHVSVLPFFREIFNDPRKTWIFANAKFDMHMLANTGGNYFAGNIHCTQVMHSLLFDRMSHRLKDMAQHLLGWRWSDFQDTFGRITAKFSPSDLIRRAEAENFPLLVEYAANDAWGTLGCYNDLKARLQFAYTHSLFRLKPPYIDTLWDLFSKVEAPYTKVLWKNERNGIRIDRAYIEAIAPQAKSEIEDIERQIVKAVGWIFNPKSTSDLSKYFFDQRGYKSLKMTSGGKSGIRKPSVDKGFLDHIAETTGDPVAKMLIEHRRLVKLKGTYIDGLHELMDPNDRIHPNFNQDIARCMPEGELVLTNRGYLPVEKVEVGDEVIAHTGKARKVIETSVHPKSEIIQVILGNGTSLHTTRNHQYLTTDGWVRAEHLTTDHTVATHSDAEKWSPVKDWSGFEVSSWGRVHNVKTGRTLTQQRKGRWGHLKVCLYRNGVQRRGKDRRDFAVHKLVLSAFKKGEGETRHLNGIAWDNTIKNLEYGSSKENSQDAVTHGTTRVGRKLSKSDVAYIKSCTSPGQPAPSSSKLSYAIAEEIRRRFSSGEGRAVLARELGVSYAAVDNIIKDRTWTKPPNDRKTAAELAEAFRVSAQTIRDIWANRRWEEREERTPAASFRWAKVQCALVVGYEVSYGLTIEVDHSHVTGGIVTHNTGRLSSSDPNCFHPATEILTPTGWVRFNEYEPGTAVAQWSPGGSIEFVVPTGYIKKAATHLTHIKNQHIRLKVTEDHRCPLRNRRTNELRVFSSKDYPEDWQQLHAGRYVGGAQSFGADWVRLLVAVQADGHIHGSGIDFAFKKRRKTERLLDLLQHLGVLHSHNPLDSRSRSRIRLLNSPATTWLIDTLGPDKTFGSWLLKLPANELSAFCEEVYFWDGNWTRKNNYSSDNEANASWVQIAFALTGKRAHWRTYKKALGGINYQVDTVDRDYSLTTNVTKEVHEYSGDVYCVSVPSSYILVRTEGEICVTGQCQNIPNVDKDKWRLRGAFIASPGNLLIVADYSQLEMRLLACASLQKEMIQIFLDGKDIHMGNAEMMYGTPYLDLEQAKKIDKQVKQGDLPDSYMTRYILDCLFQRASSKNIGFGLNYGMGSGKLANDLGISKAEAIAKIELYKETYPAVTNFYEEAIRETEQTGYAFTILGRRRNVPDIQSHRNDLRAQSERIAMNTQIQGSAADVVKMAQISLDNANLGELFGCYSLLQVHDELVHECPAEVAEQAKKEVIDWMEHPFCEDLVVPLTVDAATGPSWLSAK